jgi:hypothetical protein
MSLSPTCLNHLAVLQRWPRAALQHWWEDPDYPGIGAYGTGYNGWGTQTNQKFTAALAVLATAPELDETAAGCSREALLHYALQSLRYSFASHVSGPHHCSDGTSWGHTWISALGVERMMHGVQALEPHLTDEDHESLQRMLTSEADWLLEHPVQGTLWAAEGGNKPESNIWNGAIMFRAASLYPAEMRAGEWLEKAHRFLLNGISIPADAHDQRVIAGRPLADWHVGPNFFPHYALDHHGYLNVGYMVICLSNIAMLHLWCRHRELPPPASLTHHAADLWQLVRRLVFADGRLARIGGDSRQRYCYCQDYLLPSLLLAADLFADPHAPALEAGNLQLIASEQADNGDGSFLARRLETIRQANPMYYTRLESDKAAVLSMNYWWRRHLSFTPPPADQPFEESVRGNWEEPQHGALLHRSPRRLASWSWRAREAPQGLCLPPASGHLAEWCENLGGRVRLLGEQGPREVLRCAQLSFPGGFVTSGVMRDSTKAYLAEGFTSAEPAAHQLAVAALPDDRTLVVLEHARIATRAYLTEVKGLKLNVPNDLFNGHQRCYRTPRQEITLPGEGSGITRLHSPVVAVEEQIAVVSLYGAEELVIWQAGQRRASGHEDSLYYDEICAPCQLGRWDVNPGSVVLDCGHLVLSGTGIEEAHGVHQKASALACSHDLSRAVIVPGAEGESYVLAANFADQPASLEVNLPEGWMRAEEVATGRGLEVENGAWRINLGPGEAVLARLLG